MEKITITIPQTQDKTYPIIIGDHVVEKIHELLPFDKYSKALFVTDEHIDQTFIHALQKNLPVAANTIVIQAGEAHKTLGSIERIWQQLYEGKYDRKSVVINIGGGMVGDIGGFAASTYMRGISFIQIPTTLLAMVDASVGGKTGINFLGGKNIIGSFQQPDAVVMDVQTLKTLPKREFLSGFAEIIKHGLIKDSDYFDKVTTKKPEEFRTDELIEIITKSCRIKAAIVMADEKEDGVRKLLNFGHTIGHAVESASHKTTHPLLHGEAVSIGISGEAALSRQMGLLTATDYERIENALLHAGLPVTTNLALKEIREFMSVDKKNDRGITQWTLLKSIGHGVTNQVIPQQMVEETIEKIAGGDR